MVTATGGRTPSERERLCFSVWFNERKLKDWGRKPFREIFRVPMPREFSLAYYGDDEFFKKYLCSLKSEGSRNVSMKSTMHAAGNIECLSPTSRYGSCQKGLLKYQDVSINISDPVRMSMFENTWGTVLQSHLHLQHRLTVQCSLKSTF